MTADIDPNAKADARRQVVLYGTPTFAFLEILQEKVPFGTEVCWFGYEEPTDRIHAAFDGADVILTNRLTKDTPVPDRLKLVQLPGAGSDEIDFGALPSSVPL